MLMQRVPMWKNKVNNNWLQRVLKTMNWISYIYNKNAFQ